MAIGGKQREIVIVSGSQNAAQQLAALLPAGLFRKVTLLPSGAEARRRIAGSDCSVILINTPLSDENGISLAKDLAVRYPAGILLLVKAEQYEQAVRAAEEEGVAVIAKPVTRQGLGMALRISNAVSVRLQNYAMQRDTLRTKMEDIRLVSRAKAILMDRLNMSEAEAHRYIEKQAMDRGKKRRDIAEKVIRTYEE